MFELLYRNKGKESLLRENNQTNTLDVLFFSTSEIKKEDKVNNYTSVFMVVFILQHNTKDSSEGA